MRSVLWIAAATVVGVAVSVVVNLLTGGGAWWLWLVLAALVVAAVAVAVVRERRSRPAGGSDQRITANGGVVEDSPQVQEGSAGAASQEIKVGRRGAVRRSGQTIKRR